MTDIEESFPPYVSPSGTSCGEEDDNIPDNDDRVFVIDILLKIKLILFFKIDEAG